MLIVLTIVARSSAFECVGAILCQHHGCFKNIKTFLVIAPNSVTSFLEKEIEETVRSMPQCSIAPPFKLFLKAIAGGPHTMGGVVKRSYIKT